MGEDWVEGDGNCEERDKGREGKGKEWCGKWVWASEGRATKLVERLCSRLVAYVTASRHQSRGSRCDTTFAAATIFSFFNVSDPIRAAGMGITTLIFASYFDRDGDIAYSISKFQAGSNTS